MTYIIGCKGIKKYPCNQLLLFFRCECASPSKSGDDAHEVLGLERRATDESAVDIGFGEEFGSVRRLAATAIEDSSVVGYLRAIFLSEQRAYKGMYLLCLLGCRSFTCSDCPDRFVCNNNICKLLMSGRVSLRFRF